MLRPFVISIVYEKFLKSTKKFMIVFPADEENNDTISLRRINISKINQDLPISAKTGSRLIFDKIGVG